MPDRKWSPTIGQDGAESGNLDLVVWLRKHRPRCVNSAATHAAAQENHMHIVRWLVDNVCDECGADVIFDALENNNLEMAEFLCIMFPGILEQYSLYADSVATDIRVIEWLDARGLIKPESLLRHLAGKGKIDVLDWACERFQVELQEGDLEDAWDHPHNAVLKQAYERGMPFTDLSAKEAVDYSNTEIMSWIISRDSSKQPMLIDATIQHGDDALVEWWRVRHGVIVGQQDLEAAIRAGDTKTFLSLLSKKTISWDFDDALQAVAHAGNSALPLGTSHWDRLPRELKDMVVEDAGVLTKLTVGWLSADAAAQLSDDDKLQLWSQAFDRVFWNLRSRDMFERQRGLNHAAVRNRWDDVLDWQDPNSLAELAAGAGNLELLADLVENRKTASLSLELAQEAAWFGHLHILKWLHERMPDGEWSSTVMDWAAENGHIECVVWLHTTRTEGCSTRAMDVAAISGRLGMVRWLHQNRTEGCTTNAMTLAAAMGNLRVIRWLHENRTEGCTSSAIDFAAARGHLEVVRWLHENRSEGCSSRAIDGAASCGYLSIVEFLHANSNVGCTRRAVVEAAEHGHADVVAFLLEYRTEATPQDAVVASILGDQPHVLAMLLASPQHATSLDIAGAFDIAVSNQAHDLARMLSAAGRARGIALRHTFGGLTRLEWALVAAAAAMDDVHFGDDFDHALEQLKQRVHASSSLANAQLSESLLKRTLWAKHNDVKQSEHLLHNFAGWHHKTLGDSAKRLDITHVHHFLLTGILQVPGTTDRDGFPIIYMRPNQYLPGKIPAHFVVNALVYQLEVLTSDPKAAMYGFTFVCDMQNWGWSNFSVSYASSFFATLQGRFPVRVRKFVLVNAPSMFPLVWKIIRPMMSSDFAAKWKLVTSEGLVEIIDPANAPVELGGTMATPDFAAFVRQQYEREGKPYSPVSIDGIEWKKLHLAGLSK
nr:hypothetical protein HK105_003719 [Polyrhizophydium stewartii]